MVAFNRISLRNADRGLATGGTQSGKSTLCAGSPTYRFEDSLCGEWLARYPDGQLLIVDSKPRFRAAFNVNGLPDQRHYREWDYGPAIPNSTRVDAGDVEGMNRAFKTCRIVIVQTDSVDVNAAAMCRVIEAFRNGVTRKHHRMVFVDEVMDFYTQSGMPLRGCGNVILRCLRAGAERGFTSLLATQRAKGIPPQFWELINKLYLFRMDFEPDMKRVREAGVPPQMIPPEDNHRFLFWTKQARKNVYGPYTLPIAS